MESENFHQWKEPIPGSTKAPARNVFFTVAYNLRFLGIRFFGIDGVPPARRRFIVPHPWITATPRTGRIDHSRAQGSGPDPGAGRQEAAPLPVLRDPAGDRAAPP